MWQPTLHSQRLLIRPLLASDFESLFAAASDPLIWEQHPEPDRYQKDVFTRYFNDALLSRGSLVVITRDDQRLIGSSRFYQFEPHLRKIAIGFTFLTRTFWGGGYNTELKQLMLDHAFCFVDGVQFMVGARNFRSRRALEKLGAMYVRTELSDPSMGLYHDRITYEIDRVRWRSPHSPSIAQHLGEPEMPS